MLNSVPLFTRQTPAVCDSALSAYCLCTCTGDVCTHHLDRLPEMKIPSTIVHVCAKNAQDMELTVSPVKQARSSSVGPRKPTHIPNAKYTRK